MESFTQPGDMHTTAAAPNPPNRYTSIDSQPLLYDDAGSLTLDKAGYHYVYDYENRITRIYKLDGQTEITVARFAYDALGRRIMKEDSLNAANTRYYYYNDTWQIVTEYDLPTSAGVYKQLYAYGNYIDEVVYASCPGATYTMRRYLHDHLYSPAAIVYLTASNCILVERSEYDAYGAAHYYNADYSQTFAVSQHGNPFAFTGREIDSFDFVSGVPQLTKMHYRHRDYSPFMGRFYQQDTLGVNPAGGLINPFFINKQFSDGLNLYGYVKSNPVNYTDLYGLTSIVEILQTFFSFFDSSPHLWFMGPNDSYTWIVRHWAPVQANIAQLKHAVAADPDDWRINHITTPSWTPTMSDSFDPKNGWNESVISPPGTDPETARKNLILYLLTGIVTDELHTSSIGSFTIIATADEVSRCKAKINVVMYNEMSRRSFGRFANHPFFRYRQMASQFMWWVWKEEFMFDDQGNVIDIPPGEGGW